MSRPAKPAPATYIHGSAPAEQSRLSRLNDLLNEASLRELGLRGGESILDVGSGIAQFARAMARAAGTARRVIGIERDDSQIEEARRKGGAAGETDSVELRSGDALALPLREDEWGSFDLVHARFLLEHVADPLAVVRSMARALRPEDESSWRTTIMTFFASGPSRQGCRRSGRLTSAATIGWETTLSSAAAWLRSFTKPGQSGSATTGCSSADVPGPQPSRTSSRTWPESWSGARGDPFNRPSAGTGVRPGHRDLKEWSTRPDAAFWFAMCWAEGFMP